MTYDDVKKRFRKMCELIHLQDVGYQKKRSKEMRLLMVQMKKEMTEMKRALIEEDSKHGRA